jgi:hypothetical protein
MAHNGEWGSFTDALHEAAGVFDVPDTSRLHGPAVRRGRLIRRRRAGAVVGGTATMGVAAVLAVALSAAGTHGSAATRPAAGGTGSGRASMGPQAPDIRPGEPVTAGDMTSALEYALPAGSKVVMGGGPLPNTNVEVISEVSHSFYVQTALTIKSTGQIGTLLAVTVVHTASHDTCADLVRSSGGGTCAQTTVQGGRLLADEAPEGVQASDSVFEFLEWFSPRGYELDLEIQDTTTQDFALDKSQINALMTNQVFASIGAALPADACVGGTFSKPVDQASGTNIFVHVRCSTDQKLYQSN